MKTTVRFTEEDRKILCELRKMTGLKTSQLIRSALRAALRRVKAQEKPERD